jgi:hypothetical protein
MNDTALPDRTKGHPWTPDLIKTEHIDILGHLRVPVADSFDRAPEREGWEPFWVNINLERDPVKVFAYRRAETA